MYVHGRYKQHRRQYQVIAEAHPSHPQAFMCTERIRRTFSRLCHWLCSQLDYGEYLYLLIVLICSKMCYSYFYAGTLTSIWCSEVCSNVFVTVSLAVSQEPRHGGR